MISRQMRAFIEAQIRADYERYKARCREIKDQPESWTVFRNDWIAVYEAEQRNPELAEPEAVTP